MNINEQKAASKICEIIPVLDNKEHEMLLSYAAGMIAQKKLEDKKTVINRGNAPTANALEVEPNDICKRQQ